MITTSLLFADKAKVLDYYQLQKGKSVKKFLLFPVFLVGLCALHGQVIYVKAGSNGNGTSWEKAYGDLQQALLVARPGAEIWVAAGKYFPAQNNDRTASFSIPTDVSLYGGFAGFEKAIDQRDWEKNLTILSGEIGTPAEDDNSFTVVYTKNVSASTIIDGFVIMGGMANGTGEKGDIQRCGAGWFNDGTGGTSDPVIENCIFIKNQARDGAGLYNYALGGTCNPTISNCQFIANRADLDGGAIYNDGTQGVCSPAISSCMFIENQATYGAGMLNQGASGETRPVVINCTFKGNTSYIRGSSVYNNRQESGISDPILQACVFEDNRSTVGRDVSSTVNNILADQLGKPASSLSSSGY